MTDPNDITQASAVVDSAGGPGGIVGAVLGGSREALVALPDIGDARAEAIIAERDKARLASLEDVAKVLPARIVETLGAYAKSRTADVDDRAVPVDTKTEEVVR
jgi:hypothetical protein